MGGFFIAGSNSFWSVRGIIVVASGLFCALILILVPFSRSGGPPTRARCEALAAALNSKGDALALRKACADFASTNPGVGSQGITINELPIVLREIAANLGLSEARLEGKVLTLDAPGAVSMYGVIIAAPGEPFSPFTNASGLTVVKWKDGIYVWCATN